jgi:hypothetical protein
MCVINPVISEVQSWVVTRSSPASSFTVQRRYSSGKNGRTADWRGEITIYLLYGDA